MWRYLLKLPILHRNISNYGVKLFKTIPLTGPFFTMSTINIISENPPDPDENNCLTYENSTDISSIEIPTDIKEAVLKNDTAVRNLVNTLMACIEEICEQYQECIAKQIEITLTCMSLDPLGKHWDDLTKYRVEADELKLEFYKYEMLVERLGDVVSQVMSSTINGNCKDESIVGNDIKNLKELIQQKCDENKAWDNKLLAVSTQSILLGGG